MKIICFLILVFCISCKQAQHEEKYHHTSKLGGQMKVSFEKKHLINLSVSDEIRNFKIEVFHKNNEGKDLIFESAKQETKFDIKSYIQDLEDGYLFAVITGTINNQPISNAASFKIGEQENINYQRKQLQKRNQKYERK